MYEKKEGQSIPLRKWEMAVEKHVDSRSYRINVVDVTIRVSLSDRYIAFSTPYDCRRLQHSLRRVTSRK